MQEIGDMSEYLRWPYRIALLVFDVSAALRFGRPFRALPIEARRAWIDAWDRGALRDVLKPVRTCVLLAWFDHPQVTEALLAT